MTAGEKRAPDPLREALLWFWVATQWDPVEAHDCDCCDWCVMASAMGNAAADEVERLLGEMR